MRQPHTPLPVIRTLLEHIDITPRDRFCDLGSGDGRVGLIVARNTKCTVVGYEWDESLHKLSVNTEKWMETGAKFFNQDFRDVDLSSYDIIYIYLIPEEQLDQYPLKTATVIFLDIKPRGIESFLTVPIGRQKLYFCGRSFRCH